MQYYALNIGSPSINPISKFASIADLANVVITILVTGAGIIALFMTLYGAYMIITAAGNAERYKKAQQVFKFAIIGFAVILFSFLLLQLIKFMLGGQLNLGV